MPCMAKHPDFLLFISQRSLKLRNMPKLNNNATGLGLGVRVTFYVKNTFYRRRLEVVMTNNGFVTKYYFP